MNVTEKSPTPASSPESPASGATAAARFDSTQLAALAQQFKQAMRLKPGISAGVDPAFSNQEGGPHESNPDARSAFPLFGAIMQATPHGADMSPQGQDPADRSVFSNHSGDTPELPNIIQLETPTVTAAGLLRDLKRETDPRDEPAPDTLGAAMLLSLQQQSSFAAPVSTVAPSSPDAPRVQSLESVVAETVSRVLVSDPLHDGRREVRIEVAKEVLPDTEIRLWRNEGRLHVEFVSPSVVADNGLRDALPRLGDAIQQRQTETMAPVVSLRLQEPGAGGQPGDGRSRQQYRTPEEIEEIA